jgi:fluoroquinolone transport system permease protein
MIRLLALGRVDRAGLWRDPLLRWILLVPLLLAVGFRLLLQQIALITPAWTQSAHGVIGYIVITLAPILAGTLAGFLILDQRDEGSLAALQITPLPHTHYLIYRIGMPTMLGIVITLLAIPLAGVGLPALVLAAGVAMAALLAPLTTLLLACIAANNVQGMALQKLLSLPILLPIVAVYMGGDWQLLAACLPTYWIAQLVLPATAQPTLPLLLIGFAQPIVLIMLLGYRWQRIGV